MFVRRKPRRVELYGRILYEYGSMYIELCVKSKSKENRSTD